MAYRKKFRAAASGGWKKVKQLSSRARNAAKKANNYKTWLTVGVLAVVAASFMGFIKFSNPKQK